MKFLVCVIAAFAALQNVSGYYSSGSSGYYSGAGNSGLYSSAGSSYSGSSDRELMNQINMKILRDTIRERAAIDQLQSRIDRVCPGYGNRLGNVTDEIMTCVDTIDENEETTCSIIKNHVKRCLNPLTSLFEECLPSQAKQLPNMVVDMMVATSSHLCKTDGEHIFELGNICVKHTNVKSQRCVRKIATQFQQYQRKESLPSAADICDLFKSLRPCLQSHLNTACGHPVTRETYLELFDEAMKVCKNYEKNEIELVDIDAN